MKIMVLNRRRLMLGALLLTSGCSGGNDTVASAPPPPIVAKPSYDSFVGLNKNITVPTSSSAVNFQYTGNGVVRGSITRDTKGGFGDGGISVSYDAASKTYTVGDGAYTSTFAPADKTANMSSLDSAQFDYYRKYTATIGREGIQNTLRLYRAGDANSRSPQLSYTTFAIVTYDDQILRNGVSGYESDSREVYAIGGFETLRSDLPKSGTASYTSFVAGSSVGIAAGQGFGRDTDVTGSAKITADFGNGSLSTALSLNANAQSIGDFSGTAPIEATTSHFKGDLTANGATQGTFSGSFFGPQAAEVGYTFRVESSIGTVDGGAVGAK